MQGPLSSNSKCPGTRIGSCVGVHLPRNIGGRAKTIQLTLQELHDLLDHVRVEAIEEGFAAHERTTRLPNPRHPECQMCDHLFARDELAKRNRDLQAAVETMNRRGGR